MRNVRFNWRWIGLIIVIALIVNIQVIPWPIVVVLLVAGGGYLIYTGWQVWNRASPTYNPFRGTPRVKYWRGQRIELDPPASSKGPNLPSFRSIGPAIVYFLFGAALMLGGMMLLIEHIGRGRL